MRFLLSFLIIPLVISCNLQPKYNKQTPDAINKSEADSKVYNFGEISDQDSVRHVFKIVNKSDSALVITQVHPGCTCIEVAWSLDPVPKNGVAKIQAVFIATGMGHNFLKKSIIFKTNQDSAYHVVYMEGTIKKPAEKSKKYNSI